MPTCSTSHLMAVQQHQRSHDAVVMVTATCPHHHLVEWITAGSGVPAHFPAVFFEFPPRHVGHENSFRFASSESRRGPSLHDRDPRPQFCEKTSRERKTEAKMKRDREKKTRNFWPPTLRAATFGAPPFGAPPTWATRSTPAS